MPFLSYNWFNLSLLKGDFTSNKPKTYFLQLKYAPKIKFVAFLK